MNKSALFFAVSLLLASTANAQPPAAKESVILLQSSTSWDGTPYATYPQGSPELTVRKVTIQPGSSLDWHSHPMPAAAYVVSGELTVAAREGGKQMTVKAGEAFSGMVDLVHRGTSGDTPTELIVFYAGTPGMPLSQEPVR